MGWIDVEPAAMWLSVRSQCCCDRACWKAACEIEAWHFELMLGSYGCVSACGKSGAVWQQSRARQERMHCAALSKLAGLDLCVSRDLELKSDHCNA